MYSMWKILYCFVFAVLSFKNSDAKPRVDFIKPCDDSKNCLKNSLQAALPGFIQGIPELGIDSLDPFDISNVTLLLPGNLRVQHIQGVSKGLKKCVVDTARMVGDTLDFQIHCNLTIKGKYRTSGQLLMFAINGEGNSMIRCRNIKIQGLVKLGSIVGQDGKKYLEIRNFKSHHNYDGQVFYRMDNLINGNPQLSAVIVEFMNNNWRMVAEEFGTPIVDFGITSVLNNVKKFFKAVPMNEIVSSNIFDV